MWKWFYLIFSALNGFQPQQLVMTNNNFIADPIIKSNNFNRFKLKDLVKDYSIKLSSP